MTVYRYQSNLVSLPDLSKFVATAPTVATASSSFVDITIAAGATLKTDLDEVMASRGFSFVSTDPVNTPTQAVGAALGTSFDIRDVLAFDHFITGSIVSERIGIMGWLTQLSGTGADLSQTAEVGHPGILDFGAGTQATGIAAVYLGDAAIKNVSLGTTQPQVDMEWLVRVNAAALASGNNERLVLGFGDLFTGAAGSEIANGIYVEFAPATSANFQLVNANASTRARVNSTIAVAATTWYRIGIQVTYPGGVPTSTLFINGINRGSATANFPTATMGFGARMDAAGGTEPRYAIDYVSIKQATSKET